MHEFVCKALAFRAMLSEMTRKVSTVLEGQGLFVVLAAGGLPSMGVSMFHCNQTTPRSLWKQQWFMLARLTRGP